MNKCRRCGSRHLFNLLWCALPWTRYTVRNSRAYACLLVED